jgi:hypothetical protein
MAFVSVLHRFLETNLKIQTAVVVLSVFPIYIVEMARQLAQNYLLF